MSNKNQTNLPQCTLRESRQSIVGESLHVLAVEVLRETDTEAQRHLLQAVLEQLVDHRNRQHDRRVAQHVVHKRGRIARNNRSLD